MSVKHEIDAAISKLQKKQTELNESKHEIRVQIRSIKSSARNCRESEEAIEKLENMMYQIEYMQDRYQTDIQYYEGKRSQL